MLHNLPRYTESEMLQSVLAEYGYGTVHADKSARKIVSDSALLGIFHDNAIEAKTPLADNFLQVFGNHDLLMAHDLKEKAAWLVSEAFNKLELANYYRDAVRIGLQPTGLVLTGSVPRLTPMGWQNLHDLLSDEFLAQHPTVKRIEIMSSIPGTRWREPSLGLGVTMLNLNDIDKLRKAVDASLKGENREDC